MKRKLGRTAAAGVLLCAAIGVFADNQNEKAAIGSRPPDVAVRQWLTSDPPAAEELAGKPYVVEFWAVWCPPCVRNVPHLIELQRKYGDRLAILAISKDSSPDKVKEFIEDKGVNYHVAMDAGASMDYGVSAIPTVFLINHTGKVAWKGIPSDEQFDRQVEIAVRKAAGK